VDNNQLDMLGLVELKRESNDTVPASSTNRSANIVSMRVNYHPSRPWWVSGRFAYKQVKENLIGVQDNYSANLLSGRVTYDITNRWSLGAHVSSLQGRDARQYAYGLEAGYTVVDNFLVVLGYTWRGFKDTDLAPENYTNRGWYLGLRYKFDEDLFNSRLPRVNKTLPPSGAETK
jgi:opacity protein-like surface antigen